jgi:hypothetical protein
MVRVIVRVLLPSIRIVTDRSGATIIQLAHHNIERQNHRFGEAVLGVRTFVPIATVPNKCRRQHPSKDTGDPKRAEYWKPILIGPRVR